MAPAGRRTPLSRTSPAPTRSAAKRRAAQPSAALQFAGSLGEVLKESFFQEAAISESDRFFEWDPFFDWDPFFKFALFAGQEPGRPVWWFPVLVFACVVPAGG
jgi:hypothetical protein